MSPTQTSTQVYTRTHTATFLSELIMGTVADILGELGIDLTRLYRDWDQDEQAIKAWIEEGSLEMLVLECKRPTGSTSPVFEFPVEYKPSGFADPSFVESRASLARYRAKLDSVPSGTEYRLVACFNGPRTPQPGWSPGNRAGTQGMESLSFGTLGEAPEGRVSMRYLR